MAQLGSAGSPIDIKLGEVARAKAPQVNYEMQLIYNSVHLLNGYLEVLREALEGTDSQDPSQSLKFRRTIHAVSAQSITTGSLCSIDGDLVYKGVGTTDCETSIDDPAVTVGSTGTRRLFTVDDNQVYVALEDKAPGESIALGVPDGVIKLPGCKCGQILWGAGARTIYTQRNANQLTQALISRPFSGDGAIYLANPISSFALAGGQFYRWEGFWMPGFPYNDSGTFNYNRNFLYPIGVCILDDYAMICPRIFSPSPVHNPFTGV